MKPEFQAIPGAEGWQLSNAPVFSMAVHKASLETFEEAGMSVLRRKSEKLTAFLEFVLRDVEAAVENTRFEIITPMRVEERGCQLSVLMHGQGKPFFDKLTAAGVIADWREPNVIRLTPIPLYNSFEDVFRLGEIMKSLI